MLIGIDNPDVGGSNATQLQGAIYTLRSTKPGYDGSPKDTLPR